MGSSASSRPDSSRDRRGSLTEGKTGTGMNKELYQNLCLSLMHMRDKFSTARISDKKEVHQDRDPIWIAPQASQMT